MGIGANSRIGALAAGCAGLLTRIRPWRIDALAAGCAGLLTRIRPWRIGAVAAAGTLALSLWAPQPAAGGVFLTRDEALKLAFPGCEVERETAYLTRDERRRAGELAGARVESRLVVRYRSDCGRTAYFDVHRVRTLAETLMVVVDADGRVAQIEVLAFLEPEEYIPRRSWYEQFLRLRLDSRLRLKRKVHAVTGATLTARATTDAVRRVLALDQVLRKTPFPDGELVP